MHRKFSFAAAALVCGLLLLNAWVAHAATSTVLQVTPEAHRVHLPFVVGSDQSSGSVSTPTPTPSAPSIYTGLSVENAPWDMNPVLEWEQNVAGKTASIINFWSFWSVRGEFQGFDRAAMNNVRDHGSIPMVTWAPEHRGIYVPDQPDFRLANIIAGQYDADIRLWAGNARLWGHPFFLRFAHEANGSWFPWCEDANGNQPGEFVQAWRHVHDLFRAEGATNVTWVWCMNEDWPGSPRPSFQSLYPGDAYVDWTCLDGYNWGTQYGGWRTFDGIFSYSYDTILKVSPDKPIMLGEWATSGTGGSAADWITDAFAVKIPTHYPKIRAEVWYNVLTNVDWRVESWPGAPEAFRAAMTSGKYRAAEFGNLSTTPIPAP